MNTAIINEKKNKSNFFSPCFTSPPPPPATPTNNHLVIFASVSLPFYTTLPPPVFGSQILQAQYV